MLRFFFFLCFVFLITSALKCQNAFGDQEGQPYTCPTGTKYCFALFSKDGLIERKSCDGFGLCKKGLGTHYYPNGDSVTCCNFDICNNVPA
ncbi:hypothetical protein L596_009912 [Steinernema carpocapsae]|uniref:Uncharacterized protein n=1 Tax=Steinernema carpocapsae TaxID=34508 RepID=A0A4U5PGY4_STECR|nr:hypothetical protein L596_009912 [Steinernema carpocapsae]